MSISCSYRCFYTLFYIAFTTSVFQAIGVRSIKWPTNSPNLNPIETIWDETKGYIQNIRG
ncbi:hypothetical protein BGZ60DRAFT_172423 [Tricladium varicosporioides]|nr:hypothetical protein BGZ60DRAFT_172423 [Hymenoscyphus varicosporioides]